MEISNSKLLITGGTGSFGNAYLNKALNTKKFSEIRILSRDEKKQDDLRRALNDNKIKFYLGDVRDYDSVINAIDGVDFIFHAAALKQVPSCEFFPLEAVKTNILGTDNVLTAADQSGVSKVVILSTDKAAYPINSMGMSKALMEKVMIAKSNTNTSTTFCGTRYGNVMGSRGSVIPLFINQIKSKKNITITSPEMTRFLMSLDNAVDLVDYAFNNCNQGDMFIQKAPSCTIKTLAEALIEIFESNSKVKNIGIRHGEKMHETLVTSEEMLRADETGDFFKIKPDSRDLNYENYFSKGEIEEMPVPYSSNNNSILDKNSVINLLMSLPLVNDELKS
ncbi:MAG: UDP-glucose 4-epimerase [Pelagibacterales bacterium]|nr:UDP-glucose 4-epimerase [Pelagibacterales bacterium]